MDLYKECTSAVKQLQFRHELADFARKENGTMAKFMKPENAFGIHWVPVRALRVPAFLLSRNPSGIYLAWLRLAMLLSPNLMRFFANVINGDAVLFYG